MELHLGELMLKAMAGRPLCTSVCLWGPSSEPPRKRLSPHAPPLRLSRGTEVRWGLGLRTDAPPLGHQTPGPLSTARLNPFQIYPSTS